jgi:intracellular sulfur oxidation DsrE/DsrF family protein
MSNEPAAPDRRTFLKQAGALGTIGALATLPASAASALESAHAPNTAGDYDLSWIARLANTPDKAVVDATGINDGFCLQIATRYLDNCDAAYGVGNHRAHVVLNVRTRAIAIGMGDALWDRYKLGAEYSVKDRVTKQDALRNPFLTLGADQIPAEGAVNDLLKRGATVLVCDFAMGHLASRLAMVSGETPEVVHKALRDGLVPGAYAVPSGIFGVIRAQNAGCGFVAG